MDVQLTRGFVAQIDDADAELVQQFAPWSAGEYGRPGLWYAFTNVKTERGWRVLYMHRLIIGAPPRQPVDHVDDDGLNNRRDNLQLIGNGPNIAKGRRPERKTVQAMAPKETTKRRGQRAAAEQAAIAGRRKYMTHAPECEQAEATA